LVRHAIEARASDLYIHSSVSPFMRVHGQLESGFAAVLEHAQIMDELQDLLSTPQWEQLAQQGEVNLCVTYQMGFRLRINVLRGKNGVGLSMRLIPPDVRSLGELRIPMAAAGLTNYHQGLVVVGGPASAGKSATMAALVQRMAEHRKVHIITIEDPIEYVYKPNNSTITQRNIGLHTQSYATALKAALREDPDVIIVGELNDQETIRTALTASETGHLVIGSMTAWDVEGTIVRLLDAFEEEEEQVRGLVADTLRGVLVQQLVRTTRGELAPVLELMFNNSAVGNCIRKRKLHQISSLIHAGKQQKMISWEDSVRELKNKGHLSPQDETRIINEVKRMSLQAEANKPQGRDA
jgi:twitching motility protein PilT